MSARVGTLSWISEFVIRARVEGELSISEQVWIGEQRLAAEVIGLTAETATIQVYEDTTGLRAGDPLYGSGRPLSAVLGPGLLGSVYDGLQRSLPALEQRSGAHIERGARAPALDEERRWRLSPRAEQGHEVAPGDVLGVVQETSLIEHRVLVPPGLRGELVKIAGEGEHTVTEEIAVVRDRGGEEHRITMAQRWPIRRARPLAERLRPNVPLVTGQRVIDSFFPVAKGGPAAIPGGFGTGKTVLQHSLAQWSDADIIIYIGCGERGNEMTEVLEDFPELEDPWTGRPLMERTLLIANTSNMPVAAREASVYTGVTIAEYYRDQGYDVAVMADSTSRWAQALREISGRLGEMPIEEGYPAYLPSRISAFYERAGRVRTLGGRQGSVTLIGAVSPPGGDFSEPVTRHTQRFTRSWWALSRDLAHKRHYPAVDWLTSYSLQIEEVAGWWREQTDFDWRALRGQAMDVLQEEAGLQQIVQLVGPEALSDDQQWLLLGARVLREGYLQQNALSDIDAHAVPKKQMLLLSTFLRIYDAGRDLLASGAPLHRLRERVDPGRLLRLAGEVPNDELERIEQVRDDVLGRLRELSGEEPDEEREPGEGGERPRGSEQGTRADRGREGRGRHGDERAGRSAAPEGES